MRPVVKMKTCNLVGAEWNYKTDGTEEQIDKLIRSIEHDNSIGVIAVRELDTGKFEVIDGNHRFQAVKQMGWTEVMVEDFGRLSKAEAIVLSRRRNHEWFEDDLLEFGKLLQEDVIHEVNESTLKSILPDSEEDIQNMLQFNMFDWKEPVQKEHETSTDQVIKLKVKEDIFELWMKLKIEFKDNTEADVFKYALEQALK